MEGLIICIIWFCFTCLWMHRLWKAHALAFSDLKKSRMLSYRYNCRSMSNPGEIVTAGMLIIGFLNRRLNCFQRKLKLCMLFIHTHREMIELSYVLQWFKETTNKLPPELCEWWLVLLVHQLVAVHFGHFWMSSVLMQQLLKSLLQRPGHHLIFQTPVWGKLCVANDHHGTLMTHTDLKSSWTVFWETSMTAVLTLLNIE